MKKLAAASSVARSGPERRWSPHGRAAGGQTSAAPSTARAARLRRGGSDRSMGVSRGVAGQGGTDPGAAAPLRVYRTPRPRRLTARRIAHRGDDEASSNGHKSCGAAVGRSQRPRTAASSWTATSTSGIIDDDWGKFDSRTRPGAAVRRRQCALTRPTLAFMPEQFESLFRAGLLFVAIFAMTAVVLAIARRCAVVRTITPAMRMKSCPTSAKSTNAAD